MKLETRIRQSIKRRNGTVFSRSELAPLSSQSQVTHILSKLVSNGELLRISRGIYARAKCVDGEIRTFAPAEEVIKETAAKLGLKLHEPLTQSIIKAQQAGTIVVEIDNPRTNRKLSFNGLEVLLRSRSTPKVKPNALKSSDRVPTKNVGSFVIGLAAHHNVSYIYNSMDQFADSVTTLAGDDVKHDRIEDLLVALKRAGKLSMQQVAQLSVNYLRERHSSV